MCSFFLTAPLNSFLFLFPNSFSPLFNSLNFFLKKNSFYLFVSGCMNSGTQACLSPVCLSALSCIRTTHAYARKIPPVDQNVFEVYSWATCMHTEEKPAADRKTKQQQLLTSLILARFRWSRVPLLRQTLAQCHITQLFPKS